MLARPCEDGVFARAGAGSIAMIERKLRYRFRNPALLETALAHGSYANGFSCESNERLEFLGRGGDARFP